MKNILSTALLMAFVTAYAHAEDLVKYGHEVGNGGNILLCKNAQGEITKTELLDLFEARVLRGLESDLGDPKEDYHHKIVRVLKNFSRIAPIRAAKYQELYNSFFQDTAMVPDADLVFIPDADNIVIPKNCDLRQVAIQRPPEFPGDKRYTISKDYWDLMDNNSRAGLVLHEILYNEAIYYGHTNSKAVRYLNSYLTSKKIYELTQEQMAHMLYTAKFHVADLFGILVFINRYDADGNWKVSGINTAHERYNFFKYSAPDKIVYKNMLILCRYFTLEATYNELNSARCVLEANLSNFKAKAYKDRIDLSFSLKFTQDYKVWEFSTGRSTNFFGDEFSYEIETPFVVIKLNAQLSDQSFVRFIEGQHIANISGIAQFEHKNSPYKSPLIVFDGSSHLESQKVKIGRLFKDSMLNTPQGVKKFKQNFQTENQLPVPPSNPNVKTYGINEPIQYPPINEPIQDPPFDQKPGNPILTPPSDCNTCNVMVFDVDQPLATVKLGVVMAGEKLKTDLGDIILEKDSDVEFRDDGIAVIKSNN